MRLFSSRTIFGMLLGWAIAFEGFFALSISDQAIIEGIGGIRSSTFFLAALQLTFLGILISIIWTLKIAAPKVEKPRLKMVINVLTSAVMLLVAMEGLIMVFWAGNVNITGFGSVGKKFIVLIGAQLFLLGIMSLRLWRLRNVRPTNWLADGLGSTVAALLTLEGLTVMGVAGSTTIDGLGNVMEATVFDAGLQLFLLGSIIFILWTVSHDPWLGPRINKRVSQRILLMIMVVLGAIVAAQGALASTMADRVAIEGSGSAIKIVVVAGCAQLFALGLLTPLLWKLGRHQLNKEFLFEFLSPMAMAVLAFEGVFAIGLAANTHIDGIGTILESTFRLAGLQLLTLSAIGLMAWLIKDSPLLGKWPKRVVTSIPIMVMSIAALEGLAVAVLAANIRITDFSGVGERYVLLGGAQMVVLAALAMLCWARTEGISVRFKVSGTAAAAFALLMLPFALLL